MGTGKLGKTIISVVFAFAALSSLSAQVGGDRAFSFLHLSPSARITGLGTIQPAVLDDDPIFAWQNPATLNASTHQALSFNHSFFPAGIQHSSFMYAHSTPDSNWHLGGGIQYLNYGDFDLTDESGVEMGQFNASDLAVILSGSRQLHPNYFVGMNAKFVRSQLESYASSAMLFDFSAMYRNTDRGILLSITAKNLGFFLSRYSEVEDQQVRLPFDFVIGFSKRLKHLPFRYGVALHHLYQWDIAYNDPDRVGNPLFEGAIDPNASDPSAIDNLFRHINFNGEFLLGKHENLRLRIAYSHLLRQELKLNTTQTLSGFSLGFGFKISRFRIDYGRSVYHLAGGIHHLSIGTRLSEFL